MLPMLPLDLKIKMPHPPYEAVGQCQGGKKTDGVTGPKEA